MMMMMVMMMNEMHFVQSDDGDESKEKLWRSNINICPIQNK